MAEVQECLLEKEKGIGGKHLSPESWLVSVVLLGYALALLCLAS